MRYVRAVLGILVLLLLQAGLIYFACIDIQRFEFTGGHYEVVNQFPRGIQGFVQAFLALEVIVVVVCIITGCLYFIFGTKDVPEK